jgi:hypothetical protein
MTMVISGSDGITFPDSTNQFSGGAFSFKNRIINGDMRIDQRNNGAAVTINALLNIYTLDRWVARGESTDGAYTAQRSTLAPSGFSNSLGITVTTADASIGSTQLYTLSQFVEGFNTADFAWGTAGAQTVTLSFWVRSSVTGTFSGAVRNSAADRSYLFTFSISSANTWEQKTVTIPGDTSGTWLADNGVGIRVTFSLGAGSSFTSSAGSWQSGNFLGATGAVNLIATNGATFYITGVQLEVGSVATPFERRPYGTELALCQRYFLRLVSTRAFHIFQSGCWVSSSSAAVVSVPTASTMRSAPSVTYSGGLLINGVAANGVVAAISAVDYNQTSMGLIIGTNAVMSPGNAGSLIDAGSNNSAISLSAEP